ncbi:MAG: hypothetical protein IRZ32_14650 [Solirubrobacteraceae bacterium]|nr:hypothetical protein [Solirubrobacteraceae bacterium]
MDPEIVSSNHRAGLILLAGFLASFVFIRFSTRMMRNPKYPWWPGSIKTEGIHIHHLVFGIILMIVVGFVQFTFEPGSPWLEILAALFGIGVGLTVDEFALWLYLDDVYWTEEGRASVDAGVLCALLGGLVILGFVPSYDDNPVVIVLIVLEQLVWASIIIAKGKVRLAVIGLFVPIVGQISAIRLARPNSWWARRFYDPETPKGARKLAKATARAEKWDARRQRWLDVIGGRPHLVRETGGGEDDGDA